MAAVPRTGPYVPLAVQGVCPAPHHRALGRTGPRLWAAVLLALLLASTVGASSVQPHLVPARAPVPPMDLARPAPAEGGPGQGTSATTAREMPGTSHDTWSSSSRPHPGPIPWRATPAFFGHYWTGGVFSGTPTTATSMSVEIPVPADNPESGDFYYVLLSTWDDAGSYDQVGFTNDAGVWGLTYSYTSPCAGAYYYNPDAHNLAMGVSYTFAMSIRSGDITFSATAAGASAPVWKSTFTSGGKAFEIHGSCRCSGGTFFGLTDYEEVYQTTAPEPPYEYYFVNTTANASLLSNWSGFSIGGGPSQIAIGINTTTVAVINEPFALALSPGSETVGVERGATPSFANASLAVRTVTANTSVSMATSYAAGSWIVRYNPLSGTTDLNVDAELESLPNATMGTDYIAITATDSSGDYSRISLPVDVRARLAGQLTTSVGGWGADSTENGTLTATHTGGVGPYAYQWSSVPDGCAATPTPTINCTFGAPGTYPVAVTVSDSAGYSANLSATFTIAAAPHVDAIQVTPGSRTVDLGQPVVASPTISGGTGGYSVLWTGIAGCENLTGLSFTCYTTSAGNFTLRVSATDAQNVVARSSIRVQVLPDPSVAAPTLSRPGVDAGQSVQITAEPTGGTGVYTVNWTGLPAPCLIDGTSVQCSPGQAGSFPIGVTITDTANFTVSSVHSLLTVSPALYVNLTSASVRVALGGAMNLLAAVGGGSGRLSFSWGGLPQGCPPINDSALSCTPAATGTYTVSLEVTDRNGGRANDTVVVAVVPAAAGLGLGSSDTLVWVAVGALGAIGAAALVIVLRRRHGAAVDEEAGADDLV